MEPSPSIYRDPGIYRPIQLSTDPSIQQSKCVSTPQFCKELGASYEIAECVPFLMHLRQYLLQNRLINCWFSHDVTKIQTKKLSILARFYFHDALEQLKTNCQTNFRFKRGVGFVIEYA